MIGTTEADTETTDATLIIDPLKMTYFNLFMRDVPAKQLSLQMSRSWPFSFSFSAL